MRTRRPDSNCLVIIPALNEKACIDRVVGDAHKGGFSDVLVIDDGSTDATGQVARAAGAEVLALPFNLGIGGAVQTGLKFALEQGYTYVVRLDGDGQHCVEEAAKLLAPVRQDLADIAIGSRFFPHQHTYCAPLARAVGIRWFSMIATWLTRQPVYDPTSGMLAMNRRAMKILAVDYPQDYPEVEARILMHKAHLRVVEVPVIMRRRAGGTSSITIMRAVYYVFKVSLAVLVAALRQSPSHDGGGI